MQPLPIDPFVPEIERLLDEHRRLVVSAPPGSGKSTRIPPALIGAGRVILLQPRRVAARSLARRIARERGWTLGRQVGWQIRHERNLVEDTRLVVATEGILVRKLVGDPLLSDTSTVILDEFHERSIHADLSLALVRQAMAARDDLRLVVMSATMDAALVSRFLGDAPLLEIPGSLHPVSVEWLPGVAVDAAVRELLGRTGGDVLCFLPGVGEIRAAAERLADVRPDVEIHELHGRLDMDRQEAAIMPSGRRKVILSTNVAETSLTVEGVEAVVDSGLHRVLRYDRSVGIDRLQTERVPRDAADQRAGRAGRVRPGIAVRLWDPRDELRPHREAEIHRVDLAGVLLDVIAWGGHPRRFEWFDAPDDERVTEDLALLEALGAVRSGRLTDEGRQLQRIALHPRLGRVLLSAEDRRAAARLCAIVEEGDRWAGGELDRESLGADVTLLLDRFGRAPENLHRLARELERSVGDALVNAGRDGLERAILRGYPDRVAKRRERSEPRLLLSNGQGALLAGRGLTPDSEYVVAIDVRVGDRDRQAEALVRLASLVDPSWLTPTRIGRAARLDGRRVRGVETAYYGAIALSERRVEPESEVAERILTEALAAQGLSDSDLRLERRLRVAGLAIDVSEAMRNACVGRTELPAFNLGDWIPPEARSTLASLAPDRIPVPSGREVALDYRENGDVVLAVKLQELFGLAESPRVGPDRRPVLIELLAPNGRPVQVTSDLRSFWQGAYQEVRRELRGRYPKHPWPEDPWNAEPTARTKRRR